MRTLKTLTAAALAGAFAFTGVSAQAADEGTTPLANVLLADGDTFDNDWRDFDIVTQAVLAVLEAKPDSPVKVLLDGDTAVTAFIPNDGAFARLIRDVAGERLWDEEAIFKAVAGLGIDTVEQVLLYHVVAGATVDSEAAVGANGADLTMANGGTVGVKVYTYFGDAIQLVDADDNDRDGFVVTADINKGNKQIAHGISRVLRPADIDGDNGRD